MKRILPLFLALALLLTGCTAVVFTPESTSQTASQVDSSSPASAQESGLESAPSSSSSPQTDAEEISLTDSNGTQITLHTRTPRVVAASEPYPGRWTHHLLLTAPEDVDGLLAAWLAEAYRFAREKQRRA